MNKMAENYALAIFEKQQGKFTKCRNLLQEPDK